ncbi:SRPBCC domain-containing protein [Microbacterium lacus]|uniref:SRPBCC domain-containing protein n=1 Tax=Microbacterium lacus TaxID=415217 RepID=UPI00384B9CEB
MNDLEPTGELLVVDGKGTVRMEDLYRTDIDNLWAAITSPHRVARWLGSVKGDLRVGGLVHMSLVSGWDGPARIDTCDPPHHLSLTNNPGAADETRMVATLTREGPLTRLRIEEAGFPLDATPFHGSGWQAHVEDLRAHLEGRPASDWETRWKALTPGYQEIARTRLLT